MLVPYYVLVANLIETGGKFFVKIILENNQIILCNLIINSI